MLLADPRANTSMRPGPQLTASGLDVRVPWRDSQPDQAPLYHLWESSLPRPRANTSSRPLAHEDTAGAGGQDAAQGLPARPTAVEPFMLQGIIGAPGEHVDAARTPAHGCRIRREDAAERFPARPSPIEPLVLEGVVGAAGEHVEATSAPRCDGRTRRELAAERFPLGPLAIKPLVLEGVVAAASEHVDTARAPAHGRGIPT
jgi:hypothetical protein